jgi:hypothetical protein
MPPIRRWNTDWRHRFTISAVASVPEAFLCRRANSTMLNATGAKAHGGRCEMLSDDRYPRILIARDVAKFHHAHWDGGHPGNAGIDPLAARMCGADTYDTLVTDRPYRKAVDDRRVAELNRVAGSAGPVAGEEFRTDDLREAANEGLIHPAEVVLDSFQLITALTEDRGFL